MSEDDDIRNRRRPMAREDKIVLSILGVIAAVVSLALMIGLRSVLTYFGAVSDQIGMGLGLKESFIAALVISFFFMIVFTIVAGEGVVGELGIMLVGFFVMLVFFTISIAVIL